MSKINYNLKFKKMNWFEPPENWEPKNWEDDGADIAHDKIAWRTRNKAMDPKDSFFPEYTNTTNTGASMNKDCVQHPGQPGRTTCPVCNKSILKRGIKKHTELHTKKVAAQEKNNILTKDPSMEYFDMPIEIFRQSGWNITLSETVAWDGRKGFTISALEPATKKEKKNASGTEQKK